LFSGEGEVKYGGNHSHRDSIKIGSTYLDNAVSPQYNIFNSTISGFTHNPTLANNNGIDIDIFDVNEDCPTTNENCVIGNNQTSTTITIESRNDAFYPSMITFAAELYVPRFCYDYAYQQQGIYFTEHNDGTHWPRITGNPVADENITTKIFIKNLVDSDIQVHNMTVNIVDINTSQATYVNNSVKKADNDNLIPIDVPDSILTISSPANNPQSVRGIDIGTVDSQDYFYIYYNLNPSTSDINISLSITADYNLTTDTGVTIPYHLKLGENMEMCSNTDFAYAPAKGIFNVVHNHYYTWNGSSGNKYYNIPTQVTNRQGNFKVISMDPDNLDTLKSVSTVAAVEMIDASAFHDTNASCQEQASAINNKLWVTFENNVSETIFDQTITTAGYFNTAKRNSAFRVSYNLADENGSIIELDNTGGYTITNFELRPTRLGTHSELFE
jgi:hypothetical protein